MAKEGPTSSVHCNRIVFYEPGAVLAIQRVSLCVIRRVPIRWSASQVAVRACAERTDPILDGTAFVLPSEFRPRDGKLRLRNAGGDHGKEKCVRE